MIDLTVTELPKGGSEAKCTWDFKPGSAQVNIVMSASHSNAPQAKPHLVWYGHIKYGSGKIWASKPEADVFPGEYRLSAEFEGYENCNAPDNLHPFERGKKYTITVNATDLQKPVLPISNRSTCKWDFKELN